MGGQVYFHTGGENYHFWLMDDENLVLKTLILWDSTADLSGHAELVYSWNGYKENGSLFSLLRYVEANSERLREKYLDLIHDLGETQIQGKRLVEHLNLGEGFSLWWMSLLAEKSPWKSSIVDFIRLMALEEIVLDKRPGKFLLVSANRNLHEALKGFCEKLDISYQWQQLSDPSSKKLSRRVIYCALPHLVQALITLVRHVWVRWPLRKAEKSDWFEGENSLFFCSYFFHINPKLAEKGCFNSRYWEGLQDLMGNLGLNGNWLQHYYPHEAVPNPDLAVDWAQRFNRERQNQGFHVFLDTYLSWRVIFQVLKRWIKILPISWRLRKIKNAFKRPGSCLSLWPLMKGDWHTSIFGSVSIGNLLCMELFDGALRNLPHQKKGLYVCENQGWERALIHAWNKHGHGKLIAVAHAVGRFWDLRYFNDSRVTRSSKPYSMPQATATVLYGKEAIDAYLSVDHPMETIVNCEDLRMGHLNNFLAGHHLVGDKKNDKIKVLIVGEFTPSGTIRILQLLEEALSQITVALTYTFKPHPNYYVKATDYPSLNLEVVTDPLEKIIRDYDIVYSANKTTVAVDAYVAGLPGIVMLDGMELNLNPLRGKQGACFVGTAKELADALQMVQHNTVDRSDVSEFYFLDPELPRWRRLLSSTN